MFRTLLTPSRYGANARYVWAKWRVERSEILVARPPDALPPSYVDLWTIYRAAKGCATVLEFGVGLSTRALSLAAKRVISIEADQRWAEEARAISASEIIVRPIEKIEYNGEPCHRFVDVPQVVPDLVFLDGPSPRDVPEWSGPPISADPLFLDMRAGSKLIVDSRKANVDFLRRHEHRQHIVIEDAVFGITIFEYV